mgnify:CR=1 FL=1
MYTLQALINGEWVTLSALSFTCFHTITALGAFPSIQSALIIPPQGLTSASLKMAFMGPQALVMAQLRINEIFFDLGDGFGLSGENMEFLVARSIWERMIAAGPLGSVQVVIDLINQLGEMKKVLLEAEKKP